ncbi:unnamed protein product [Auanema sp. JU1783]|nr:unnamed protein product [Auanema sp. JU1783]
MKHRSILIVLYLLLDIPLTTLLLGFFSPSKEFHFDNVLKYLLFLDGYSFIDNPFDFVVLACIRALFLITAVVLIILHKEKVNTVLFTPVLIYTIFCYSYTLIKLLAFAEKAEQIRYWGLWYTISFSILSPVLFCCLWSWTIAKKSHHGNYGRLVEDDAQSVSSQRRLFSDLESLVNTEDSRISTSQHAWKLLSYCRYEWVWFASGFFFLNIYAFARVFIPSMMGDVIANIVKTKGYDVLIHSVIVMSILLFISSIAGGLRGGCFDYASARVSRRIRQNLFSSLVLQDIAFFDITKTGEIVSRLTSDCQTMSTTVATNLNVFLRNGIMLIGAMIYMFVKSWKLAMVTVIAVPLVACLTKLYGGYFDSLSEKIQDSIGKANHIAEEVLSTMRTVRSFACEHREAKRFDDHLETTLKMGKKKSVAYMGYTWTNEVCDNIVLVAVLFYGGHLVLSGQMATEDLITFLLYQMQLGENLASIGYVFTGLMESIGASRKVFEYMNRIPVITMDGKLQPEVNGEIVFEDVHFTYPSRPNNEVLKGLNLKIEAGRTVALVGPSGGGKSSIVAMIQHFYEPNSGSITLDGVKIENISHSYYHQKIALVAQEPVLYDGSIRYNILYGCDFATEDDMLAASKMANVHNFVMELEKGYDTNCGDKGVQMSGGQKQRIAIARALVRNPAVLILDEATSALDAESEALVQEALNRCVKERTVLIIAHRLSTIEKADTIAVIQKGCLVQSGCHQELMLDKEGLYYSLVAKQLLAAKVGEEDSL